MACLLRIVGYFFRFNHDGDAVFNSDKYCVSPRSGLDFEPISCLQHKSCVVNLQNCLKGLTIIHPYSSLGVPKASFATFKDDNPAPYCIKIYMYTTGHYTQSYAFSCEKALFLYSNPFILYLFRFSVQLLYLKGTNWI